MIEWMQTHRKWLVITIWVATIAFIGAGFVGWGQFQFGKKADEVAKVGNTPVTIDDVQSAYNQLFNEYNNALGGKLDEATAKKLGLDKMAFNQAIQTALLREYAKNLGLTTTDKDVADKILEVFKNEKEYKTYLRNTGQKAADFEKRLRKQILVEKLLNYLQIKPSNTEILTIASALYNADKVKLQIIQKDENVSINENEIKKYWEAHKNEFLSPKMYKIAIATIPLKGDIKEEELKNYYEENKLNYKNSKGEIKSFSQAKDEVKRDYLAHKLKKEAILTYKDLKNSKGNYKIVTLPLNNDKIPLQDMMNLIQNGFLKPKVYNNEYITAKLLEEIKPTPLPYEKAKPQVIAKLLQEKSKQKLIAAAKNALKNFSGKDIGFVTKYDANKIDLPTIYAQEFLFTMFLSQKPKDYILIPKNNPKYAAVYQITEQKLLDKEKFEKNRKYVENLANALINAAVLNDLLNELYQKYKIVKYVKG